MINPGLFFNSYQTKIVKSIQNIQITIAAGSASNTATITAVNKNTSLLLYQGMSTTNSTALSFITDWVSLAFTNNTTITATTHTADATYPRSVNAQIIEFYPNVVKSVQYGNMNLNGVTSGTATITAVNTATSAVFYTGSGTSTSSTLDACNVLVQLTNSTTLTFTKFTAANSAQTGWGVIQFYPNILKSVNQVVSSIALNATTGNATITAVNTANCLTLFNGQIITNAGSAFNTSIGMGYAYLSNSTTITAVRGTSSATIGLQVGVTILEFNSNYVINRQAGQITIATASTSNNVTVTASPLSASVLTYGGITTSAGAGSGDSLWEQLQQTSSTNITATRGGSTSGITGTIAWELLTFH